MGLASTSLVPSLWKWCGEDKLCLVGVREGQDGQLEAEPAVVGSLEAVAEEQAAAEGAARQARVSFCASKPHISPFHNFCQTQASPIYHIPGLVFNQCQWLTLAILFFSASSNDCLIWCNDSLMWCSAPYRLIVLLIGRCHPACVAPVVLRTC